uniref:Uncharacterized protein n=1 Tax=Rhodnius prolixus TaxID=13249 RepID=T1I0N3_RHOPR
MLHSLRALDLKKSSRNIREDEPEEGNEIDEKENNHPGIAASNSVAELIEFFHDKNIPTSDKVVLFKLRTLIRQQVYSSTFILATLQGLAYKQRDTALSALDSHFYCCSVEIRAEGSTESSFDSSLYGLSLQSSSLIALKSGAVKLKLEAYKPGVEGS